MRCSRFFVALLLGFASCTPQARIEEHALTNKGAHDGYTPSGIHYVWTGNSTAPAVVLIHASGLDLRMWDREASVLSRSFRVLRYDLRGHGSTRFAPHPDAPYEELDELLNLLGLAQVSLVGLSTGALVATDFAVAYPKRVSRLVLASPNVSGYVPTERMEWFGPIAAAARAGRPDQAAALFAESPPIKVEDEGSPSAGLGRRLHDLVIQNARMWSDTSQPSRALAPPAIGRLGSITAKTLVMVGSNDMKDVRLVADTLARSIRDVRLVIIPEGGHMLSFSAPVRFDEELFAFLARR
ncbi:MAG: alpha/beta hydrolase [Gemmatimonadota bacterium]|nr:alpha/beta hydrolase [Gemmatimonadota bacterium]